MRIFTAVFFLSANIASSAFAADAIIAEEPALPAILAPTFSWDGGYIGGNFGYDWAKSRTKLRAEPDSEMPSTIIENMDPKSRGFLGGVYTGYNFAMGDSFLLGIETDAAFTKMSGNQRLTVDDSTLKLSHSPEWVGTARIRAAYTVDRFLPFLTGGLALGLIKTTAETISAQPDPEFDGEVTERKWRTGYTLGGGVDYAATDNLILRLEYRFTDFGKQTLGDDVLKVSNRIYTNDVRLGIAYKF
ncbi:MAG: outer membrane protein [Brucella intermedia]